jgi:peptidyl-prolyl cis-trans isomerase D
VLDAVLLVDASSLPAWVGVDMGPQGFTLARVNKVLSRTTPVPATVVQERKQFAQWVASAENQAYYKMLTQRFKVQIKAQRPARAALGQQTIPE